MSYTPCQWYANNLYVITSLTLLDQSSFQITSNVLNEEISGSPERDQGFQGGYQEYYFKVLNMYSISINCYSNTNWFCNYSTTSKK